MELTLEDLSAERRRQDPYVLVELDKRGSVSVEAGGECNVYYAKMLITAVQFIREEMNDAEEEEFSAWFDGD